jgi:lactose/L-arabinose transport system ATP-binding protein
MADVELRAISKAYGALRVIEGMDLRIEDGSFTVFVGPSGCGKSTLLRMIAGLEEISAGDMIIGGRRVNDADPIERGVAMVFQNYALYPHMTVAQNIGFSLRMAGLARPEIDRLVVEAAQTLQIEELLQRKPAALSGGQRQRVAIGRAIVRDPEVFLFDEPLSNLDAELRVSMRIEISRLHRKLGATMIYVTHDQTEAMTLADNIIVLRAGRIEQQGTPEALYEDPANAFVAGFIGSPRMNFLRGTAGSGGVKADAGPLLALPAPHGGPVQIGLRPEHLVIGGGDAPFAVTVDVVENLGGTRFLYGRTTSDEDVIVEARDLTAPLRPGSTVQVGHRTGKALLFSPEGARLRMT